MVKKSLLAISFLFCSFVAVSQGQYAQETDFCDNGELMQQAFCAAKNASTIVDRGNTPEAVGNRIFRNSSEIEISLGGEHKKMVEVNKKGPLLSEVIRFFLTFTIVISVTMIIYNGILYIVKSGGGKDPNDVRDNLLYLVIGILVALMSISIVTLFQSAGNDLEEATSGVSANAKEGWDALGESF